MYDIIFCIFGCDTIPKYKNEILKINETWGKIALQYNIKLLYNIYGIDFRYKFI